MVTGIPNSRATFGSPILWITLGHERNTQGCQNAAMKKPKFTRSKGLSEAPGICGALRMECLVPCAETGKMLPMTLLTSSLPMYRRHVKFQKLRARAVPKASGPKSKSD